jgi:hypothetical protein
MSRAGVCGAAVAVLVTACASGMKQVKKTQLTDATAEVDVQNDPRFRCELERPTGSHVAQRICRYKPEIDEDRRETQDHIRRVQSNSVQTIPGN